MDISHTQFLNVMWEDPSVDREQLHKHFGKNYTEMLRARNMADNPIQGQSKEESAVQTSLHTDPGIDDFDRRKLQEGKLEYIGV